MTANDPKQLQELLELAKVNGTEYMLIDDGNTSLKIKVDTLLGYMTSAVTGKIATRPINVPLGTILMSIFENVESDFEERFGGSWTYIGSSTLSVDHNGTSSKTIYLYQKLSKDSGTVIGGSSFTGSGIIVIPEDEEMPAVSRTSGMFYLNVIDRKDAHFGNGLNGNIVVSSNMGLKVIEE